MAPLIETTQQSQHGTWIEIRRDRLLGNLDKLKNFHASPAGVMAIIKANAYGHGILEIARTLAGSVSYFGVSSAQEVLTLKEHDVRVPVLLFGRLFAEEILPALTDGVAFSVSDFSQAEELSQMSASQGRKTPVHVKVDTGMGRFGIPFRQAQREILKMAKLPGLLLEGIYTHFPTAELDDGFRDRQIRDFSFLIAALKDQGVEFRYRHAANSAGILKTAGNALLNLMRPGLMLYGAYPDRSLEKTLKVSPILSLKSRIVLIKKLQAGETAGYGRQFMADQPTTIAILPVGYSHGYPFRASHQASVLYHGKRCPVAGRVSMDYMAIHLGDTPAKTGDTVTLIGEDGGDCIRPDDLADWAGTHAYEILTHLQTTLPRFYR